MTDHAPLTSEELARLYEAWQKPNAPHCDDSDELVIQLIADLRSCRAEVERLRAALTEATEEMEDMVAYVPDHFRAKWKYDEAIARAKKAVSSDG